MTRAQFGTRWRRATAAAVGGFVGLGGLSALVATDVLALNVTFQGVASQMSVGALSGDKVAIGTVLGTRSVAGNPTTSPTERISLATVEVDGLCFSQQQSVAGATYTITVMTGDGSAKTRETVGSGVLLDASSIDAIDKTGLNLGGMVHLGVTADSIDTGGAANPLGAPSGPGWYGIGADAGSFGALRAKAYGITLDNVQKMPGLKVTVAAGEKGCDAQPIPH